MPGFGDFYNKNRKKLSKEELARKAAKSGAASGSAGSWVMPAPQVIKKGKKDQPAW